MFTNKMIWQIDEYMDTILSGETCLKSEMVVL